MTAQIIALPTRERVPTERELADRLEVVCIKLGVHPRRPGLPPAEVRSRSRMLYKLAADWGLSITVNGPAGVVP